MPIEKLAELHSTSWLPQKQGRLDPDAWNEAVVHAEEMLFTERLHPTDAAFKLRKTFSISAEEARDVVFAVLEEEAEPITMFSPMVQRKIEEKEPPPVFGNMVYFDRDGDQHRVDEFLCHLEQARTLVAIDGDIELFCLVSQYDGEDAVAEVVHHLASLGEANGNYEDVVAAVQKRVFAMEAVVPEDFMAGPDFSVNLLRGMEQIITADLSTDIFDGANDRPPF